MSRPISGTFPTVSTAGVDGLLISFGDRLTEPANRAALAFRAAVEREGWAGVEETSSSLVSAYLRFDPLHLTHNEVSTQIRRLLDAQDWYEVDLPAGRHFWRVPAVFGTDLAPQLGQAAAAAGMSEDEAIVSLSETRLRVQTIGFAPGQPYLGELPEAWDIPRQSQLTRAIPVGALCVAIRQLVLFPVSTPTGWLHVGQTAIRLFQPEADTPFLLRPGDEVQFVSVDTAEFDNLRHDPHGGAESERLR